LGLEIILSQKGLKTTPVIPVVCRQADIKSGDPEKECGKAAHVIDTGPPHEAGVTIDGEINYGL
jgi:hypothetical protein